jgi:hypothetical protein
MAQQSNSNQGVQGDGSDINQGRETPNQQQDERDRNERYDPSEPARGRDNQDDNRQNESDRSGAASGRD